VKNAFYIIVIALTANFASAGYPSPAGLWQFNDPNHLTRASLGEDLVAVGTHTAVPGIDANDGAVADPIGSYLICNHGIAPNGGGSYVNNWTVMMDVKVPASSIGQWVALYQTNIDNSNDADCFVATDRTIGVGDTGYSRNKINGDTWYRVVISVSNMNFYRIYVNGLPWKNGTVQPLDGRFALDPQILFFADDNGEDNLIYCTNLAIWGQALEDSQVAELGNTTTPIVIDISGATGSNLLENPSAEKELDNWIIADGNDWQATDRTDWHYPHTGNYYFTAGRSAHAEINQVINLGYMATAIDSGSVIANVRGHLGGNDSDQGRIIVEYLDADDAILATTDSGWVIGPNSVNWTQLVLPDADGFVIPSGTRSAKYRLLAQRTNGTDCHAYFDDLVWEYRVATPGNNAPGIPSIAGPSSGTIGIDANYTFVSVDPDANQVDYQIDWGDEISDWSDFQASGSNYIVQHNWPVLGTYSVRARSRDTNGALSAWSSPFSVTISGDAAGVFNSQPYLQNVSQDAITIAWETDRIVNPTVDWGLTSSYGNNTEGLCINAGSNGSSVVYTCKVRISGLNTATTYHYRARNGSTLGSDATFKTAPDEQTPFIFAVAGDSQMVARRLINDTPHPECSSAMFTDMASMTDITVSIGDVVDDSSYGLYVSAFRPYMCNILGKQKPVFIAFGNHDEPSDSLVHKAVQNSGMHSFSFNYGNAHFTCIDYSDTVAIRETMTPDGGAGVNSLPLGWIEQDLSSDEAQNATWRFFFIHVPPYSERWFDGSSLMQTYLVPMFNRYNVQACFSGHVHEYERGMKVSEVLPHNGTFYVITGCMNYLDIIEDRTTTTDWPFMTVGGKHDILGVTDGGGEVHGWTEVQINGAELHLIQHAYNLDGTPLEGTSFGAGVIDTIDFVQADFNGDKTVDFEDLAILADAWLSTPQDAAWNPACNLADRAQNIIDFKDFAVFAQYWHFNGQF
jgi:Icc-related predicted phosphoesterase